MNANYIKAASDATSELNGYDRSRALLMPAKATQNPFHQTVAYAVPYFEGARAIKNAQLTGEDSGLAINGGKLWEKVRFCNRKVERARAPSRA